MITLVDFVYYLEILIIIYFFTVNFSYLALTFLAAERLFAQTLRQKVSITQTRDSALIPSVTIIAPAHNEELTITESVSSFLEVHYPELEIIVVNDGSGDGTLKRLIDKFGLFETKIKKISEIPTSAVISTYRSTVDNRLIVIDKVNGGKADALNAGLNYCGSRLFCSVDADTLIERDSIYKLVRPYLESESHTIAIGGVVRVANDCVIENGGVREPVLPSSFLAASQTVEYIRSFLCGRLGWSRFSNSLLIISGAFGLFERQNVIEAGGYLTGCVGEDMELIVRLHRYMCDKNKPYKVLFLPDPVCWTQVPEDLTILARQRERWHKGLLETIIKHCGMIGNYKYGGVGLFSMPFYLLFELLSPLIELGGYILTFVLYYAGILNVDTFMLFLWLSIVLGIEITLLSLLIEEFTIKKYERKIDVARLFFYSIIENFGYRQLNLFFRLKGLFSFAARNNRWGEMVRKPFTRV